MAEDSGERTHDVLVDFDPLRITLPGAGPFAGTVRILLPEVHFKLLDLSMGIDLLEGAHVGGDERLWCLSFDVPEPGLDAGQLCLFLAEAEPTLREMHKAIQARMDETFLLG
jgi:hypothetical protein